MISRSPLALLFLACVPHVTTPEPTLPLVGFASRLVTDPVGGNALKVALFFPSNSLTTHEPMQVGPYWLDAAEATPEPRPHALIILSHGHLGSRLGHHDLAEALARAGYVVAALEHSGDSYADPSGVGTDRVLLGRAWQASAVIDALLADPELGPAIDPQRIGVAGFSAGGYTSLLLVGARPDFSRFSGYCDRHPTDPEICVGVKLKLTITEPRPTKDPRVKAAFAMAPFGILFGDDAFADVTAPILLWGAERDTTLLPEENFERVRPAPSVIEAHVVPLADHFVFLAPCPASLAADLPKLCTDPEGVDRLAVHRELERRAVRFFNDSLH